MRISSNMQNQTSDYCIILQKQHKLYIDYCPSICMLIAEYLEHYQVLNKCITTFPANLPDNVATKLELYPAHRYVTL